jgi:DNA-binding IclR family transcriptional regulator
LQVLSCFPLDGGCVGVSEVAGMLEIGVSTAYRYMHTWLTVGLIERDEGSRKYRIARVA